MDSQLKALFEKAVAEKRVPGIGAFVLDSKGQFVYKEAFGTIDIGNPNAPPFTLDTTLQIFSCTKLVTCVAALQLVEAGELSLSDPVEKFVPQIKDIQVLEGFDKDDKPILRAPKTKATIQHLFTHTAGFTYDFFDPLTMKWRLTTTTAPMGYHVLGTWDDFSTPFTSDPGSAYAYGVNIDWLGFVVQNVSGIPVADYLDHKILKPLGMSKSGLKYSGSEVLSVHARGEDGKLVCNPQARNSFEPSLVGGGGYLYSTLNDYSKFLATILNEGTSPYDGTQILKAVTVKEYLFKDFIPEGCDRSALGEIGTVVPQMSAEGSVLPSLPVEKRGWSCGLILNHEDLPQGRKKGSGMWAGLANLYYWIDPTEKKAGMIGSAVFPFLDNDVLELFDAMERNAYGYPLGEGHKDGKANYSLHPVNGPKV